MKRIKKIAEKIPYLCKVSPSGKWHIEDVHRAGGIPAILKEVARDQNILHPERITVTTRPFGEYYQNAEIKDSDVIRTRENAYSASGGLAVLFGNLAPNGAVVKAGGVNPDVAEIQRKSARF